LLLASGATPPKVISIVSTLPDEGKTTCAVSLARVMALAGERVLLLDGDLRRAGVRQSVDQDIARGLGAVLEEGLDPRSEVVADVIPRLDILTVSKPLFTSTDLFGTDRFRALMAQWRNEYDRIIIDTPPLLGIADARMLARESDSIVVVVKWDRTPLDAVTSALSLLHLDNAPVVGVMFSMVARKSETIGAYYYSRKYASYYNE
jgi:capsular exopolysaccharide synthesis family protein